jgi:hypothetical protein
MNSMGKVRVFRFKQYYIRTDDWIVSTRMAPKEWIQKNDMVIIEGSGAQIDEEYLTADGYTVKDFDPKSPRNLSDFRSSAASDHCSNAPAVRLRFCVGVAGSCPLLR